MTGAPANRLTRLSVEYSLTEHCNNGQALIDDVARRLLPRRGLRSTLHGVKELLQGQP